MSRHIHNGPAPNGTGKPIGAIKVPLTILKKILPRAKAQSVIVQLPPDTSNKSKQLPLPAPVPAERKKKASSAMAVHSAARLRIHTAPRSNPTGYLPPVGAIELAAGMAYASAPSYASQEEKRKEAKKNQDHWGNKGSIHPVVPLHPTNGRWPKCDAATWNIHMYHRIKIHVRDARPSRFRISSPQPWGHILSSLHNARITCFSLALLHLFPDGESTEQRKH